MGPLGGFAHEMLELGKDLLDRVEIRAVGRQEKKLGADAADGVADGRAFMAAEVIHDDDIARRQCGDQALFDIIREDLAVDRLVEDARRIDPVAA